MPRRHAEIAGAGIGGLTLAAALGRCGWSVRVHERAPHLRDIGVGTSLWENGHRALAAIGALDDVQKHGSCIARSELYDERLQRLRVQDFDEGDRALVVLRVDLHRALVDAAQRADAEIATSSEAVGATADGTLVLADGRQLPADLVVGCDGYLSPVRDSLGLADEVGFVTEAQIGRITVPRAQRPATETIREYWAAGRACGVLGCGEVDYLFLSAPEDCPHIGEEVRTRRLHKPAWIQAFPALRAQFENADGEVIWGRYSIARCSTWSTGRAAILGDAAHAMPSTLAQGAGCAMMNGIALAAALDGAVDIPAALAAWERQARPVTEATQNWAVLYVTALKRWPMNLLPQRSQMVSELFASPAAVERVLCASRHVVALPRDRA
jgi:2-polyprenyl-6-methoxyphenol hydroxylase-like FAD-dependent oxidoreductase